MNRQRAERELHADRADRAGRLDRPSRPGYAVRAGILFAVVATVMLGAAPVLRSAEPGKTAETRRYAEGKHGTGELRYVDGIPVLTVGGTPQEIGAAFGELAVKAAKKPLIERVDAYVEQIGWGKVFPTMLKAAPIVRAAFPSSVKTEMATAAKHAQVDLNLLSVLNAIPDLEKVGGCSTFVVDPKRSTTGKLLFGRNLDWPAFEELPAYTMVTVFRPKGKHAVAAVGFPILFGCLSGMNDAGVCLSINEITASKDKSPRRNLGGTPMMLLFRQLLEECTTVAEVEAKLKAADRTTWYCLTVCDAKEGCVFEVTPKNVVRRDGVNNCCACTNHFRTDPLSVTTECPRYVKLARIQSQKNKLGWEQVAEALHAVNQRDFTIQTMIFEPEDRVIRLAWSDGRPPQKKAEGYLFGPPATEKPLKRLDLKPFFKAD